MHMMYVMILEKPVGPCPIRRREERHGFWPLKDEEKGRKRKTIVIIFKDIFM